MTYYSLSIDMLLSHLDGNLDGLTRLVPDAFDKSDDDYDMQATAELLHRLRLMRGRIAGLSENVARRLSDQMGPANRIDLDGGFATRDPLSGYLIVELTS